MKTDKVKIQITPNSRGTKVFVNDVELKQVKRIEVSAAVDEASVVKVEFVATEVNIEGEVSGITNAAEDPNQGKLDV